MDRAKLLENSEKFLIKGQIDKALEGFEALLRHDPNDLKLLSKVADLYLKKDNTEKAIDYLDRVGTLFTKDGFYSKAVAIYKRILKLDAQISKAALISTHEKLADLYGQLGLISDAMSHLSVVVDHYDQTGDRAMLLSVLKKVSDLDPLNVESQLKLVELFLAEKREAEALETLQTLDQNVRERGQLAELIRVHERWVELFPKEIERLQELVQLYLQAKEPKRALARIQVAFKADPRDANVLELLSATFRSLNQPDKAKTVDVELMKLYKQSGDSERFRQVEARTKDPGFQSGITAVAGGAVPPPADETDPAEALIEAMALSGDERKILSECDVYLKYGLVEKAFDTLSSKISAFPQSLALRWRFQRTALELGKRDEATHALSEIVLLSEAKALGEWAALAKKTLKGVDPRNPALEGSPVKGSTSKAIPSVSPAPSPKSTPTSAPSSGKQITADLPELTKSEISVIVEDDSNEFSEISFEDLNEEVALEPAPEKAPEEESQPILLEDMVTPVSEEGSIETLVPAPETLEFAPHTAEVDLHEDSLSGEDSSEGAESILTEADFSDEELQQLSSTLAPETPATPAMAPKPAPQPIAVGSEEIRKKSTHGIRQPQTVLDDEFEIRQALEEVEFFKAQGLHDEAKSLMESLKSKYANHPALGGEPVDSRVPKIQQRDMELETLGSKVHFHVQKDDRSDEESDFFDLAAELNEELVEEKKFVPPAEVKEVFKAFKAGVSANVDESDWQTHFDLGVAYREMGLLDDAIEEFELVQKHPEHLASALYQIGVTHRARGDLKKAQEHFERALKQSPISSDEKLSCSYELAEVLLELQKNDAAKVLFQEVERTDPEYRDVQEQLKKLAG